MEREKQTLRGTRGESNSPPYELPAYIQLLQSPNKGGALDARQLVREACIVRLAPRVTQHRNPSGDTHAAIQRRAAAALELVQGVLKSLAGGNDDALQAPLLFEGQNLDRNLLHKKPLPWKDSPNRIFGSPIYLLHTRHTWVTYEPVSQV